MHGFSGDPYDVEYHEDHDHWDKYNELENKINSLDVDDLNTLTVKIDYYWVRQCSLGCAHKKKRFRIINLPTILDMIAYFRCGMPARKLLAKFLPDFFYDLETAS